MPTLPRFLRFNLVGLLGFAVQLTALAALNHLAPHHYLLTSTAALELTLLHNVTLHLHYTWRDRTHPESRLRQIIRFHLANGLISLAGNLALIRLLVHTAHMPVVAANATAILTCSFLNFWAGERWIFPGTHPRNPLNQQLNSVTMATWAKQRKPSSASNQSRVTTHGASSSPS